MLTACVCVRDEAELLAGCLASLAGAVDRIVVADNGSRDASAEVARAAGAEVIDAGHIAYARARNLYLDAVREGWVLVLDADERLVAPSLVHERLGDTRDGFALPRYEYLGGGAFAVVEVVRLFRAHPDVRYFESSAHASVVPAIEARGGALRPGWMALHHVDLLQRGRAAGKRARAKARAEAELARPDPSPLLDAYHGLELAALGAFDEALAAFARSEARDERCKPTCALFAAHVHDARGDLERAAREAARALDGGPWFRGTSGAHTLLAEAALAKGDVARAWSHAIAARAHRPRYASNWLNLAALATLRGLDPAPYLARARRLNPWLGAPAIAAEGERPSLYAIQRSLLSLTFSSRLA